MENEPQSRVAEGKYDGQFVVDVFQTGSGTSTNMNANEVIGHLADAHPNDHVNQGQSSNDVIPTAMHVAAAAVGSRALATRDAIVCRTALAAKAREFHDVIKIGRTHLQDAVPMRLGQEFSGYASQVRASIERIEAALPGIYELPLGGTAVGTGLNAHPGFAADDDSRDLRERTGLPFREARNHFEAQASKDAVVIPERRAAELCRRADEDRERHSVARLRAAVRARRAEGARHAAGFEHHAGQSESGDRGERLDGVRAGDRL